MKWLFVVLFLLNVFYFGWEFNSELQLRHLNAGAALDIPAGVESLYLLSELAHLPEERQAPALVPIDKRISSEETDLTHVRDHNVSPEEDIDATEQDRQPICFSYGPIPTADESMLLADWFQKKGARINQRHVYDDDNRLFWVYLTSQEKSAAIKIIEDLKKKGVKDLLMVSQDDLSNIISLGLFSSQSGVNRRLREIEEKGYRPVVVPYHTEKEILWLDVMLSDYNDTLLAAVHSGLPSIYNSVTAVCSEIAFSSINS